VVFPSGSGWPLLDAQAFASYPLC